MSKLSHWREILGLTLWSDSLFAPTWLYVEIVPYIKVFFRHLGIYVLLVPAQIVLGCETQRRFPFGDSSLLSLVPQDYFRWDLCWNFPAATSELISFGAGLDRLWDSRSLEIPYWGFLFVFPSWGLPWLFVRMEIYFPPLEAYCSSTFLGEYIESNLPEWSRHYLRRKRSTGYPKSTKVICHCESLQQHHISQSNIYWKMCDVGCTAIFTETYIKILNREGKCILTGTRTLQNHLWGIQVDVSTTAISSIHHTNRIVRMKKTTVNLVRYHHS